jgi:hypothetical protein
MPSASALAPPAYTTCSLDQWDTWYAGIGTLPAQIVPKTRKFKRTRWHDIVSDVFKDSQYASCTFKDKMLVAKRLYAQEKREGSAADRTRVDREETQVRSKEQRATLSRAGSMRRSPPRQMNFNSGRR